MSEQTKSPQLLLRLQDVRERLGGMSRTWVYMAAKEGRFPKPIRLGGSVRWVAEDVDQWIESQRRQAGNA